MSNALAGAYGAGSALSFLGSMMSNKMAAGQHKRDIQWMERMVTRAHQHEVNDLRAAGLNPILSATGGKGAASPSIGPSNFKDLGASISGSSAVEAMTKKDMVKQIQASTRKVEADADSSEANAFLDKTLSRYLAGNPSMLNSVILGMVSNKLGMPQPLGAFGSMMGSSALKFKNAVDGLWQDFKRGPSAGWSDEYKSDRDKRNKRRSENQKKQIDKALENMSRK